MTSLKSPPTSSPVPTAAAGTLFRPASGALSLGRFLAVVGPCALIFIVVMLIAPWIGSTGISWDRVYAGLSPDREIFDVRIPRIFFGAIVGGALAVSGVLFQAILRN